MEIVNIIELETPFGNKAIELIWGDVSKLSSKIDLLIVSAFKKAYTPIEGTLIGALKNNLNIDVRELSKDPEFSFSENLGVWISKEIDNPLIARIACVEILDYSGVYDFESKINSLFGLLNFCQMHNISFKEIAMPLIGSGHQGIAPDILLPFIIPACEKILKNTQSLRKIIIIEQNEAKVKAFDEAFNQYLTRSETAIQTLPKDLISDNLKNELLEDLVKLYSLIPKEKKQLVNTILELKSILNKSETRFFELGLMARRIAEAVVKDILGSNELRFELWKSIDSLRDKQVSSWIIGYLHILRTFGNVAAHETDNSKRMPADINAKDILTLLFCLNRVIDFWKSFVISKYPDRA